jgi:hypothetical protein
MQAEYKARISDKAAYQVEEHIAFLANVSKSAARRLHRDVIGRLGDIEENPYSFPVYETEFTEYVYRKVLVTNRISILYTITEEEKTANIEYIWDMRMNNTF